jgi:hypothetical protein
METTKTNTPNPLIRLFKNGVMRFKMASFPNSCRGMRTFEMFCELAIRLMPAINPKASTIPDSMYEIIFRMMSLRIFKMMYF